MISVSKINGFKICLKNRGQRRIWIHSGFDEILHWSQDYIRIKERVQEYVKIGLKGWTRKPKSSWPSQIILRKPLHIKKISVNKTHNKLWLVLIENRNRLDLN